MIKKPSGAENRKRMAKKQLDDENLLKKVPKINQYFSTFHDQKPSTSGTEHLEEKDRTIALESKKETLCGENQTAADCKKVEKSQFISSDLISSHCENCESQDLTHNTGFVLDDPSSWNTNEEEVIEKIIRSDLKQDLNADFTKSERQYKDKKRCLSVQLFSSTLPNGETIVRDWLLYSRSKGCVYCIPCIMFQPKLKQTAFSKGFSDWKHASQLTKQHEQSSDHRENVFKFLSRKRTTNIDSLVLSQYENEVKYWRNVLTRVVSVVRFLAMRGLPFSGSDQNFGSLSNGLFLGCLELLSEFDPFLSQHIAKYGNKGKGSVSYLSSDTCNEFIDIMSLQVFQEILKEINNARYFSLIVDSTPDISHTDQLAIVIRYVSSIDASTKERLLRFLPVTSHKAESLEKVILGLLENLKLDIEQCRGQSYDNASNMSGVYTGLQSRIKNKNEFADYVPCAAHSLNLVGCYAAEKSCPEATIFFAFVQNLYNFFSSSTYRWGLLKNSIKAKNQEREQKGNKTTMIKSLSETRWSARADAVTALLSGYHEIKCALENLKEDTSQTPDTRLSAKGLHKKISQFEIVFLTLLWNDILERINKVNETLQREEVDLLGATKELQTLQLYIKEKRNSFEYYENLAINLSGLKDAEYERARKRKLFPDDSRGVELEMDSKTKFRIEVFLTIIDNLTVQLKKRRESYASLANRFEILSNLQDKESDEIRIQAKRLSNHYNKDLESDNFVNECLHFQKYLQIEKITSIPNMYAYIKNMHLHSSFPNLEVAMRMYLTLPVSNCSAERNFSALKRIKNERRSCLSDEKLNNLMLLCTQSDILLKLDFSDIIDDFARKKVRKKAIV